MNKYLLIFFIFLSAYQTNAQGRIRKFGKAPMVVGTNADTTEREVQYGADGGLILVQYGKANLSISTPPLSSTAGFAVSVSQKVFHPDGGLCIRRTGTLPSFGQNAIYYQGPTGSYYERYSADGKIHSKWAAKADSSNETTVLRNLFTAAQSSKKTLVIDEGIIYAPGLESFTITSPLEIEGLNGARLDLGGDRLSTGKAFIVRSSISLKNVGFQNGGWIMDPSTASSDTVNITIKDCVFKNVHAPVQFTNLFESSTGPSAKFNVLVTGNRLYGTRFGFCFNGMRNITGFIFTGNYLDGIDKLAGVRVGEDNQTYYPSEATYIISNNVFKNLRGRGLGDADRGNMNAVAVFGNSAVITSNIITNVSVENSGGLDGEAIYAKCRRLIVTNNEIKDVPAQEGAINHKGQTDYTLIADNIITNCYRGINSAATNGRVNIHGNLIVGFTDEGIHIRQRPTNHSISIQLNNIMDAPVGHGGISYEGCGHDALIANNMMARIGGSNPSGALTTFGIKLEMERNSEDVDPGTATYLNNVQVVNNNIRDVSTSSPSTHDSFGIYLNIRSSNFGMRNIRLNQNNITAVDKGIGFYSNALPIELVEMHFNTMDSIRDQRVWKSSSFPENTASIAPEFYVQNGVLMGTLAVETGITTPTASFTTLNVGGVATFISLLKAQRTSGNFNAFEIGRTDVTNGIRWKSPTGSNMIIRQYVVNSSGTETQSGGWASQTSGVVEAGNVGIGSDPGDEKLTVTGNQVLTGTLYAGAVVTTTTSVTGTSQTAVANTNYITNNASLVTIMLPTNSASVVGDCLEIIGLGAGGWRLSQPEASTLIHWDAAVTTTGTSGYVTSAARYNTVRLRKVAANEWVVTAATGTPTFH